MQKCGYLPTTACLPPRTAVRAGDKLGSAAGNVRRGDGIPALGAPQDRDGGRGRTGSALLVDQDDTRARP
jgi:hypothetical protein